MLCCSSLNRQGVASWTRTLGTRRYRFFLERSFKVALSCIASASIRLRRAYPFPEPAAVWFPSNFAFLGAEYKKTNNQQTLQALNAAMPIEVQVYEASVSFKCGNAQGGRSM